MVDYGRQFANFCSNKAVLETTKLHYKQTFIKPNLPVVKSPLTGLFIAVEI